MALCALRLRACAVPSPGPPQKGRAAILECLGMREGLTAQARSALERGRRRLGETEAGLGWLGSPPPRKNKA